MEKCRIERRVCEEIKPALAPLVGAKERAQVVRRMRLHVMPPAAGFGDSAFIAAYRPENLTWR